MNEIEQLQIRCVSHEIRNQISICEMYSEIIKKYLERDSYENSAVSNAIECIKKSTKMISNSLIDLKSINNNELKICDLKQVMEEGVRLSSAYTFEKEITINLKPCDSVKIYADEIKFTACIVNILKNACEAIENKGFINISCETDQNKNAIILISNNGKPIPSDKQEAIFKEGYTTKTTGSGLGLHICNKNLQSFNGSLKLVRSDNKLTEFKIVIPTYDSL